MSNFADVDYQLRWPRSMFRREAAALVELESADNERWWAEAELLLREAFAGGRASTDLRNAKPQPLMPRDLNAELHDKELSTDAGRRYLAKLLAAADELPEITPPRPYWRDRRDGPAKRPRTGVADVREDFAQLVDELYRTHYFEHTWPRYCDTYPDDERGRDPGPDLGPRVGVDAVWPLTGSWERWSDDEFYELIEVLHDRVARSRYVIDHQYVCEHGIDFSVEAGRLWYRSRVNQLLEDHNVPYRLADDGEDVGRLVAVTDDARSELEATMAQRDDPSTGDQVRHALALFRARDATEHDKRSASITLAGVLEERRALLKAELFSKDEDTLFNIANNFAIRHQRAREQKDYDPIFLDWVFWWYLSTIELTDRLLARQEAASTGSTGP